MPRNTITKSFATTVAKGWRMTDDGVPVEAAYEVDGKRSVDSAQRIVRKEVPSFACSEVEHRTTRYTMTFERFRACAEHAEQLEQ